MQDAPSSSPVTDTAGGARYVGLSESQMNKLRCSGNGPRFLKLGKVIRYRFSDLDRWLESRALASTAEAARRGRAA